VTGLSLSLPPVPTASRVARTAVRYHFTATLNRNTDYTPPDLTHQAPRGRGLAIVDALVTHWGIRPGSTQVWFDITLNAGPPITPS
jgi:hypothetical protein